MKSDSPVEHFPGYVELPEFLNILQLRKFQDAFFGDLNQIIERDKKVFLSVSDEKMLPVIFDIVKEWHIKGVPEKPTISTFPATPVTAAHELIVWLTNEVYKIYDGELPPNA